MKQPVDFQIIERSRADDLVNQKKTERRWENLIRHLQIGESIFVPHMNRNALESLRTITTYRRLGTLRSRQIEVDGVPGRMLRMNRNPVK